MIMANDNSGRDSVLASFFIPLDPLITKEMALKMSADLLEDGKKLVEQAILDSSGIKKTTLEDIRQLISLGHWYFRYAVGLSENKPLKTDEDIVHEFFEEKKKT